MDVLAECHVMRHRELAQRVVTLALVSMRGFSFQNNIFFPYQHTLRFNVNWWLFAIMLPLLKRNPPKCLQSSYLDKTRKDTVPYRLKSVIGTGIGTSNQRLDLYPKQPTKGEQSLPVIGRWILRCGQTRPSLLQNSARLGQWGRLKAQDGDAPRYET